VPFGLFAALAGVLVFPGFRRREREAGHLSAVLELAHLRILTDIPYEDDFVYLIPPWFQLRSDLIRFVFDSTLVPRQPILVACQAAPERRSLSTRDRLLTHFWNTI
jgi:hypothetical protein